MEESGAFSGLSAAGTGAAGSGIAVFCLVFQHVEQARFPAAGPIADALVVKPLNSSYGLLSWLCAVVAVTFMAGCTDTGYVFFMLHLQRTLS